MHLLAVRCTCSRCDALTNIGRREAFGRIAHLLCEVFVRLRAVGLTDGHSYVMPFTQSELADASGLSAVHVNRTLQALREKGLIKTQRSTLIIEDWAGLRDAGEFDPTYLHLRDKAV